MVDLRRFLTDGYRIRWRRVSEVGVGTVLGAVFTGIASVVLGLADIPIALLSGFTDFIAAYYAIITRIPALIIAGAWGEAAEFVAGAGIAGFAVAVSIVLATLYVVAQVVSRVQ